MNNESLKIKALLFSTIALVLLAEVLLAIFLIALSGLDSGALWFFLIFILFPLCFIFACIGWIYTRKFLSSEQNLTVKRFNSINLSIILVYLVCIGMFLYLLSLSNWSPIYFR
jgi:hypothetical protein